jgi:hypothetical protein
MVDILLSSHLAPDFIQGFGNNSEAHFLDMLENHMHLWVFLPKTWQIGNSKNSSSASDKDDYDNEREHKMYLLHTYPPLSQDVDLGPGICMLLHFLWNSPII